jgi:DNA-binding winged helix-turn-helix (wHTH) protein/GTP-binding protein EngB required for normal cell division
MSVSFPVLRQSQIENILRIVARGECCAIFGLSNTGKSPLLRALPTSENLARYERYAGRPGALVYIDCNRVVELTAPGFYEIVVRSLLEALGDESIPASPDLTQHLREQHSRITTAPSVFQASLAFNNAISESCTQLTCNLVLLFDEFDEVYVALEDRALLNLRALKDKFHNRLTYITATVRPLSESRTPGDNEFAELFATHTLRLGLLSSADSQHVVEALGSSSLSKEIIQTILRMAGGHFGLLTALTEAALRNPAIISSDPNARAECLKIWNQLRPDEQAALKTLVMETQEGLNPHDQDRLHTLGLLAEGEQTEAGRRPIFSELFAAFVRRQAAAPVEAATGVRVDEDAGEVWVDGVKVTVLTDLEYRLMRLLYQRQDRLTTKDMIVEAVWGGQYLDKVDDARIEKLVSRLRAKIEPDPAHPHYLLTQRGRGYKLSSRPVEWREDEEIS